MEQIKVEANHLWHRQGMTAESQLVRDSLERFWRYSNGNDRTGRPDGQRSDLVNARGQMGFSFVNIGE